MPEPNDTHSKGNIVMVTDGASIPDPREWRLINAWSIALVGAVCALFALCLLWPDPYLRILLYLPDGVVVTFKITVMSICCAVPLGLLTGLGRISRNRAINLLASTYVEVIRGIPLLVQLFYIYYALSRFFQISGITSAVIAISVCYGAYMGEVFRAGIMAISKGQSEAARSLGFNRFRPCFTWCCPRPGAPFCRPWATSASPCSRTPPWFRSWPCPTSCSAPAALWAPPICTSRHTRLLP